jgi:integrase
MNGASKMSKIELPGTIYLNHGRYYWRVIFPGDDKRRAIPLKPAGASRATKDIGVANAVAAQLYEKYLTDKKPGKRSESTIGSLIKDYTAWSQTYYRRQDGKLTAQADTIAHALRFLTPWAKESPDDFGPLKFKQVQQSMIDYRREKEDGEKAETGLARKTINTYTGVIKAMFKWGVSEERVSPTIMLGLSAVINLHKGRSAAKESQKITAIDLKYVDAIKPYCSPIIGDMMDLQALTGMRSTEICLMSAMEIDFSGPVWLYRPGCKNIAHFKTELQEGAFRAIPLGPRARKILTPYLMRLCPVLCLQTEMRRPATSYLFSPKEAELIRRAELHAHRVTPINAGNRPGTNKRENPQHQPGEHYDHNSYHRAITRAIKTANDNGLKIPYFHPHQIRHTAATRVRRQFGLDAAKAVLGHSDINTTGIYAELDLQKAIEAAIKIG